MQKKTIIILVSLVCGAVLATGLGVLIWWLVRDVEDFTTLVLEGDGVGQTPYTAAFTKIRNVGDMFWWFYPTTATAAATRPILLWLDGVTGVPPSLLANLAMIGPYDVNFNERNDSWIDYYNLLFIDTPLGTGFSVPDDVSKIPNNLEESVQHLVFTLTSFYELHEEFSEAPLYILGQGSGAQLALSLAIRLSELNDTVQFTRSLSGVILSNGIVSPALALTKLGFYLEEMGYIDYVGRDAIEKLSVETTSLVNQGNYAEAFDKFISLGDYVNTDAQTVAVNLGYIVEKLSRNSISKDYFGQKQYLQSLFPYDLYSLMDEVVAPALGISNTSPYDGQRTEAAQAISKDFMKPSVNKVEHILQNTDLTVTIYNGNLDAVANTPGQLAWVNNLQWNGQQQFLNSTRETLAVNGLVQGYYRETPRLRFFWINAAGQWTPLDSPAAMRYVIQKTTR